ncbi:MAG: hypothetical protein A3F82_00330 [Deltaproteobacteria bacterium RIFCSPLOWO2_12_FULL_44_12]|nr:MAG: hypothetical protein A2712_04625 [Deltaproteobacteria bacterium RIFCSPHIGHO2_01_FULL_43_49]OGQ16464.1 MAG: hypothetical protein A3D22_02590 [Deltaproteobacteria bacterium RIFCSPHIGHO2_02_FULL_44_53]OGQ27708.1 MAG: hypothetical protein A3D98_08395 [Deltaproteobacteria bacterium RIFCSPHIGHO2_12_FULL_44_21]OGQ32982.1 MAG: hypothetical protein A2979_10520 [Deltaproteobacteria bacterium RIFCSPLOWO2_01_FULL_45_74]OGQ42083.1 MAG: hypothetical protein A3I70_10310 [Deltaproteobacteria bacterium 
MKRDVRIANFSLQDGTKIHYQHWTPHGFKASILFVHGIGDHCARYTPFVEFFNKNGFRVCLYDQRGHGKSEGARAHIERFEQLLEDLEQYFIFSREGEGGHAPWFLVGHSFGGQLVLNYLTRYPGLFKAACVASPNVEVGLTLPVWKERMSKVMMDVWPTMKLKGTIDPKWLSHDEKVVEAYTKDPLVSPFVTIGAGKAILNNLEMIFSLALKIKTPLMMLHGSGDRVCSPKGTKRFFKELVLAQKELKIYEGMYHELFNETNKEKVFEDLDRWFCRFL